MPYFLHLMSVCALVLEHDGSEGQEPDVLGPSARALGPRFWSTFSTCEHDLLWYYTAVEAATAQRLGEHTVVDALHRAVAELIAVSGAERSSVSREPSDGGCPRHAQ